MSTERSVDLAAFLRECEPFSSLEAEQLAQAAERGEVTSYAAGEVVLDAFNRAVRAVVVILSGEVEVWHGPDSAAADEVVGAGGIFGYSAILTDRTIGPRVVAATEVMVARIPAKSVTRAFTSPAGAAFLAARLSEAERRGRWASPEDGVAHSPLGGRLIRSDSLAQMRSHAHRIPEVLSELRAQGLSAGRVIAFYSAILDTICRRTLQLVFADHPDLSLDDFTWLSLGSNGRRESVPGSDVDAAVVFRDVVTAPRIARYREVFAEVGAELAQAGLVSDVHGTTPSRRDFARTASAWRVAARQWLADPTENKGAIMTSMLVDGRPIYGDPGLPDAARVFRGLRQHPLTMRLLLTESLATRARTRTVREMLGRQRGTIDIKQHALLPIVNLARWAALASGSDALATTDRLSDAAGSSILPAGRARTLIEVFDVLQGIRLRYQLDQIARGERPTNILRLDALSPIDHSVITRAVREIAATQRRADNVSHYLPEDQWMLPERS